VCVDRCDGVGPDETDEDRVAVLAWFGVCGRGPSEIFESASVRVDTIETVFSFSLVMYALPTSSSMATSWAPAPVGCVANGVPEPASKIVTSPRS
jgi:hypothetical protein